MALRKISLENAEKIISVIRQRHTSRHTSSSVLESQSLLQGCLSTSVKVFRFYIVYTQGCNIVSYMLIKILKFLPLLVCHSQIILSICSLKSVYLNTAFVCGHSLVRLCLLLSYSKGKEQIHSS